MRYTVYLITCYPTKRYYVGQTSRGTLERYEEHWYTSTRPEYANYPLYQAFKEYGRDSFRVDTLGTYPSAELANIWEIYYIDKYSRYSKLYNGTKGGAYHGVTSVKLRVDLLSYFEHKLVRAYPTYADAAKAFHVPNTMVIVSCIEHKPLGRYWLSFDKDLLQLLKFLDSLDGRTRASYYWVNNYSWEAQHIKEKYGIHKDTFSYTPTLWTMDKWKNEI